MKKIWGYFKDNIAAIVTATTALFAVVYAVLRFLIFIYLYGYFRRLNIDMSLMDMNFDKSIFVVIFVTIVAIVITFFLSWIYEFIVNCIENNKEMKLKGCDKIKQFFATFFWIIFTSGIILSIINFPIVILIFSISPQHFTPGTAVFMFLLIYVMEMLFVLTRIWDSRGKEKQESFLGRNIDLTIIYILGVTLFIFVALVNGGSNAIEEKKQIQLVDNEKYMITYSDGEHCVLHRVKKSENEIIVYRNQQKIISIEECDIRIKPVEKIIVSDE